MLASYGRDGTDAYDLVDRLPPGRERAAAWHAYVCQRYADKLADACRRPSDETVRVVRSLYALALRWLERAASDAVGAQELKLPPWGTPARSRDQLVGMRNALETLRTYVAYGLPPALAPRLAAVDARVDAVEALWIARPTPELRGGIGDALTAGIREAVSLGRLLALGVENEEESFRSSPSKTTLPCPSVRECPPHRTRSRRPFSRPPRHRYHVLVPSTTGGARTLVVTAAGLTEGATADARVDPGERGW